MSPVLVAADAPLDRFPRVSGDEPDMIDLAKPQLTFSPRERG